MVCHALSRNGRGHQHRNGRAGILRMALDGAGRSGREYRALQTQRLRRRAAGIYTALSLTLTVAAPAHALSCAPQTLDGTLYQIVTSPDGYVAATGVLTFDEAKLPRTNWDKQEDTPQMTNIPARLTGKALQQSGFTGDYARDVVLNVACFGPWCAGAPEGEEILAFVNVDDAPPSISFTPCGGHSFSPEMREQALACFNGGACASKVNR